MEFCVKLLSLPSWERGLKFSNTEQLGVLPSSLPSWERGLKSFITNCYSSTTMSLPSWERGLKSRFLKTTLSALSRSPRGSVD